MIIIVKQYYFGKEVQASRKDLLKKVKKLGGCKTLVKKRVYHKSSVKRVVKEKIKKRIIKKIQRNIKLLKK